MYLKAEDFERRIESTRERMRKAGLDALFIYSDEYRPGHALYYTNFRTINMVEESSHAVYLPLEGSPVAFTGPLNAFAARRDSFVKDVRPIPKLEEEIRELVKASPSPMNRVGLVGENVMPLTIYRRLATGLGSIEMVGATELVIAERRIKSEREIELLARAGEIGDISLRTAAARARPGRTELELIAIGEYATRAEGGDLGCAYLAVTGLNTDLPTWRATNRPVEHDELLWLDFAPTYAGYGTDVAITLAMDGANEEQRRAVEFAWYASARMMEFVQPGKPGAEVFYKTLELVKEVGYEEYFVPYTKGTRAIGHGVGLDIVEPPDLGPNAEYIMEPGMVLALKFDLHGFSWGGVRVEHTVAVTEHGARALNCPLSDACPAKNDCSFYKPGGRAIDIP
jgi:Xaa-Pro aminopeptidase